MFQLLFGIALGLPLGFYIGRRNPVPAEDATTAAVPTLPAPPPLPPPPLPAPLAADQLPDPPGLPPRPPDLPLDAGLPPPRATVLPSTPIVPNKRAKKLGLTEESFRRQDDILVRMQEAWERGEHLRDDPPRLDARPIGEGEAMPQDPAPEAAPGADTLSEAMTELAAAGYDDDLHFTGGVLSCQVCGETHPTNDAVVEHVRRFEGPSDPADEAILLALRCPHCGAKGLLVSPYGPDADPELANAFTYLARKAQHG